MLHSSKLRVRLQIVYCRQRVEERLTNNGTGCDSSNNSRSNGVPGVGIGEIASTDHGEISSIEALKCERNLDDVSICNRSFFGEWSRNSISSGEEDGVA